MAEGGGPGRGRGGRGAIIAKLLEMDRKPGPIPSQQSSLPLPPDPGDGLPNVQEHTPTTRVGGRGAALQRIQQQYQQQAQQQEVQISPSEANGTLAASKPLESSATVPRKPTGRGQMLLAMKEHVQRPQLEEQPEHQPQRQSEHQLPSRQLHAEVSKLTERVRHVKINPTDEPVHWSGKQGDVVPATANYIPLLMQDGRGIYEYEVRFNPQVDDRIICEKMLFLQHKDVLNYKGFRQTFDGVTLYMPFKPSASNLTSIHPVTNEEHNISLIFRRERSMLECTHMYNVLFNNIQKELNLVQLKDKEYFSQKLAYSIPQHRLEVWPGYVTSVQAFEGGIMLNCNSSTKVLRTQTVLDLIYDITHTSRNDWKERLQKQLIGQSVMTRRPVRMYRVDDIDFDINPTSTFVYRENMTMDYIEYHRRKGIEIKDKQQPLLVHRPKLNKKSPSQVAEFIHLIPELCYLTGLTDEMRSDFKVMKDVALYTRVSPNQRIKALQKFVDDIRDTPNCVQILDQWGLKVPETSINLSARVMAPEVIYFGRNATERGSLQADWNRAATSNEMLSVVDICKWVVIHTKRDENNAREFIETMRRVSRSMGQAVANPEVIKIPDDKTDTYLRAMRETLSSTTELVVIIFPTSRDDRYAAIKKLCCVDRPIPSQVINSRTISRPDKLRPIVQKIALQMNCKLGGALWSVRIPFKNAMICGIDTYHDTKNRAQCVAAFISSLNPAMTRWNSQVFIQSIDREMNDSMKVAMSTALTKYYEVNNTYPDNIIVYRDGLGDGQLEACRKFELVAMQEAFNTISLEYQPALALVVCQKRINTRIFLLDQKGGYQNPNPGTVVDHTITRRYYHDFFLISQLVRQGTVSPTHYIVLHNTTNLDPDKVQKLTYKMCHLYYNWPGTVRVPAPCQYAHKLAFLVGSSLHRAPASSLCEKLFFL